MKSYTAGFKLKVVAFADAHSKKAAAKEFRVDRRRVQEWSSKREELKKLVKSAKKSQGGGRKVAYQDIEVKLLRWMSERREEGVRVTSKALKREALRLHKIFGNQSFKASQGWFEKFKKRNRISLRRSTHINQQPKDKTDGRVDRFLKLVIRMRRLREYSPCQIGNMDETPTWLEMPGSSTMDFTGAKSVTVGSTGHHKQRYTTILGALADGTKLPPFVLLPGVRPPPQGTVPPGILIHMCGTGKSWSNAEITKHWLTRVWGRRASERRLLVWDTFRGEILVLYANKQIILTMIIFFFFSQVIARRR